MQLLELAPDIAGVSPYVLALRDELRRGRLTRLGRFGLGDLDVELCSGTDCVWAIVRRPDRGGIALRVLHVPGGGHRCEKVDAGSGEALRLKVTSGIGEHIACFTTSGSDLHRLRVQVRLTPLVSFLVPFAPRDVYPLDANDDPTQAKGKVEAAQRGLNSGLLYLRMDEPAFGSLLYFQNLTSLNAYCRATDTKPDGAVGGEWPELGFLLPTPPQSGTPPTNPLPAGEEVVISDAILVFRDSAGPSEQDMARQFLQMLGVVYKTIKLPSVEYRDWVWRADRTVSDLETSPQATVRAYGNRYVMPYVEGEVPDVMVQLVVAATLHDYGQWRGEPFALEDELKAGLGKFYDPKLQTLRRFLRNVGKDKDRDAVDAWYLYHPMLSLAHLALEGDEACRDLLLKSVDYGIRAARHFNYVWPVMYKIDDFSIMEKARNDNRFGQTDVGGIYACLMLRCYKLTDDARFLEEARAAIDAAIGMRFNLMYQANLTAWGAAACMRLWRITNEEKYLEQSYVFLASFFHNSEIWESKLKHAEHYSNFLGVTCLHDAPYMAIYECFDSFSAFEEYLADSGPDLEPAVRMLVSEYGKYALDRAWHYYPDTLPKEILATGEHQSGIINPDLSFPLEDLYGDGQSPGKIGQEIYGCGAAFVFATRSHHPVEGAPFRLFCNHFIRASERTGDKALSIQLDGGETCTADISVVRLKRRRLGKVTLATVDGDLLRPHQASADRIDFHAPANGRVVLSWERS